MLGLASASGRALLNLFLCCAIPLLCMWRDKREEKQTNVAIWFVLTLPYCYTSTSTYLDKAATCVKLVALVSGMIG